MSSIYIKGIYSCLLKTDQTVLRIRDIRWDFARCFDLDEYVIWPELTGERLRRMCGLSDKEQTWDT